MCLGGGEHRATVPEVRGGQRKRNWVRDSAGRLGFEMPGWMTPPSRGTRVWRATKAMAALLPERLRLPRFLVFLLEAGWLAKYAAKMSIAAVGCHGYSYRMNARLLRALTRTANQSDGRVQVHDVLRRKWQWDRCGRLERISHMTEECGASTGPVRHIHEGIGTASEGTGSWLGWVVFQGSRRKS